jgi:hypothetical protein
MRRNEFVNGHPLIAAERLLTDTDDADGTTYRDGGPLLDR